MSRPNFTQQFSYSGIESLPSGGSPYDGQEAIEWSLEMTSENNVTWWTDPVTNDAWLYVGFLQAEFLNFQLQMWGSQWYYDYKIGPGTAPNSVFQKPLICLPCHWPPWSSIEEFQEMKKTLPLLGAQHPIYKKQ